MGGVFMVSLKVEMWVPGWGLNTGLTPLTHEGLVLKIETQVKGAKMWA